MPRFLVELHDERMKDAFEALSAAQSPEYRAWQAMTHRSLEDGRARMVAARRGIGAPAPGM